MNIEKYISSGILESYVLDQVSTSERLEVERMANEYDEIRKEIEQIELSLEDFAFQTAITPPSTIKKELFSKIENKPQKTPVVPITKNESKSNFFKYAAAASVALAIGSGLLAYNYWDKWQNAEFRLATLVAENQQFAQNNKVVNQRLNDIQNAVAIMNNSAFSRVVMNGTENSPNALATVYWNETTQNVYLNIQNLKQLSKDQQYQLWAIIDGKPVDAGVFNAKTSSFLLPMSNIGPKAAAFAVTIEPKGGSKNPTLETMQVIGNV